MKFLDSTFKGKTFSKQQFLQAMGKITWEMRGKITGIVGTVIEAHVPQVQVGSIVEIFSAHRKSPLIGEVAGFRQDKALILPYGNMAGVAPGAEVVKLQDRSMIRVSESLLGCVVDPMLQPLYESSLNSTLQSSLVPIDQDAPNPMMRQRVSKPMSLGIKSIDGLLTFGEGQRTGIMAGSGVGKSVLLGMIAKGSEADINVIGLIGERGREVREFIERDLGPEGLKKSVVVVATGDQAPLLRIRAAKVTIALGEYFSSLGKRVLIMMDSLTRVAMAQREIGLAIGEPPTAKGYPPSTFSLLPKLLERCGPQPQNCGSMSALFTVLVDGDDFNDPIPDAARSILDGHIQLSRKLATRGLFPAIDISASASRVMFDVVSEEHWAIATKIRSLLGVYNENYDYIQLGTYQPGSSELLDQAIHLMPRVEEYLRQDFRSLTNLDQALEGLRGILRS